MGSVTAGTVENSEYHINGIQNSNSLNFKDLTILVINKW